ncbi:ATP-binding protein [Streptomyces sp. NPDC006339]|uniref:ATP-binding protein n=1 Tax=Streptomyces sp. NPDC006339 TaxID=3156755 RepID=UPI0033A5A369
MVRGEETTSTRRSLRYELAEGPGLVAQCRDLTQRALAAWFGDAGARGREPVEDVLLLVSEVVTNARKHGTAPYELCLEGRGRALWVQVGDSSPRPPAPHGPHRAGRPSGHGLYLLQRLAAHWGSVSRDRGGKTVWFEVDVLR